MREKKTTYIVRCYIVIAWDVSFPKVWKKYFSSKPQTFKDFQWEPFFFFLKASVSTTLTALLQEGYYLSTLTLTEYNLKKNGVIFFRTRIIMLKNKCFLHNSGCMTLVALEVHHHWLWWRRQSGGTLHHTDMQQCFQPSDWQFLKRT